MGLFRRTFFLVALLSLLGGMARAATFTWVGSVSTDWFNTNNWSPAGLPGFTDNVNFSSGTIALTAPVSIGGQFNWTGGNLSGSPLTIAASGDLNLAGNGSVALFNVLTNLGTINWTNTTIYCYQSGAIYNQAGALLNIESDYGMYNQSGTAFFNNAGTVSKGANTGSTIFSLPFTNNAASGIVTALKGAINFNQGGDAAGTFNASSGAAINFNSGTFTYATVPVLNGPGSIAFTGGALTLVSNTIPNLLLNGGTLSLGPNFQGGTITNLSLIGGTLAGNNTVSGIFNDNSTLSGSINLLNGGVMNWTGGTALPITVQSGGVLNLFGGNSVNLYGAVTNFGTVNWTNTTVYCYQSGALYNEPGALLNIEADYGMYNQSGTAFFNNAGTVSKGANTGSTIFSLPFTNNAASGIVTALKGAINFNQGGDVMGTFNANSGAAINFNSGTFVYDTIPVLNGPGPIAFTGGALTLISNTIPNLLFSGGTLTLGPNFQGGTITNLSLIGGTLAGNNTVSGIFNDNSTLSGSINLLNGGVMNWTGGSASPITVQSGGVLNLFGGNSVNLYGALTNFGTVNWTNTTWYFYQAGSFYNQPGALLNIEGDYGMYNQSGAAFFNNASTVSKGANTGTTTFSLPFTNNAASGIVTALEGAINFNQGGDMAGTFNANSGAAINFNSGTFVYDTIPVLNGPGPIAFTGGALTLASNNIPNLLFSGGTLTLGPNFQGGTITNLSLIGGTLAGNNTVSGIFNDNSTLSGSINLLNGAVMNWTGGNASPITVQAGGILNLIGGNSVALYGAVTNFGTVNWTNTTIYCYQSGVFYNEPGALLNIEDDYGMYNESGAAFLNNAGTVSKGANTGSTIFSLLFTNNAANGIVTALKGAINFNQGGDMAGTFNANSGAAINFNGGTFVYDTIPVLNGPGQIAFTGGALTLISNTIPNLLLNGGTLTLGPNFQGGVITNLSFFGGTLTGNNIVSGIFNNGSSLSGNINLLNGAVMNWSGGSASGNLNVASGATLNWSGGYASPITVQAGGVMNLAGGNSVNLYGAVTNFGTVNWTNTTLYYYQAGSFYNQPGALLNIEADYGMYNQSGTAFFNNASTVSKGANTGTTSFNLPFTNNATSGIVTALEGTINFNAGGDMVGTFNANLGAAINFNGGTFTYSTIPVLNGPGPIAFTSGALTLVSNTIPNLLLNGGTLTLGPNFQGGTITNLSFFGGTLTGNNIVSGIFNNGSSLSGNINLLNGAVMNWSGGSANGNLNIAGGATLNWTGGYASPITVQAGGIMNLFGGNSVNLYGAVTNFGTVNWINTTLYYYQAGSFYNQPGALLNIVADYGMYNQSGTAFLNNLGKMTKVANTGSTSFNLPFTNNAASGVVTALEGTIYFNQGGDLAGTFNANSGAAINFNGGTFTFAAVPVLNGPGTIAFTGGALTLVSNTIPNLLLNGGTLTLGPNFQGGMITNLVHGGMLSGNYIVSGTLNLGNGVAGSLTLLNTATLNWTGGTITGSITVTNGSVVNWSSGSLDNALNLVSGATLNWTGGYASPITVQAGGIMNLFGGNSVNLYGAVTNFGTVNWTNLTLYCYQAGSFYNQPGALLNIESDYGMYNQSGTAFFNNAGTVSKGANTSTTSFNLPFTNSATISVQSGTISFNNGFVDAGGVLSFGINGLNNYGRIGINGNAPFIGSLSVNLNNGYVPALGNSFSLIYYSSESGAFSTTNLPTDGLFWNVANGSTALTIAVANDIAPIVTITGPANNSVFVIPANITVNATVTDGNAPISRVDFFEGATQVGESLASPYTVTLNNVPFGNYVLTARATDTAGAVTTSSPVNIAVYLNTGGTNFVWNGSASSDWFTPGNWTPAGVPGALDSVTITNGSTATLSHNVAVASVNFSAGNINGPGILTVTNAFLWTGGTINSPLILPSGSVMNLAGSAMYLGGSLTNSGTINWLSGNLQLSSCSGGPIENLAGGVWNIQCDQTLNTACNTGNNYFQNLGTLQKLGGTNTTTISVPIVNAGTVTASTGTLNFNDGGTIEATFNTAAGATIDFSGGNFSNALAALITGAGSIQLTGGNLTFASNAIPNLALVGGTVVLGTNFEGGTITNLVIAGATLNGSNTVTGMFTTGGAITGALQVAAGALVNWTNGAMNGPLNIASNAVLNLNGGTLNLNGALTNSGTVNWLGGVLQANCPGGPIENLPGGLWSIQCDQAANNNCGNNNIYFQNLGTIQKIASINTTTFEMPFTNSGTMDVESGTVNLVGVNGHPSYTQTGATLEFGVGSSGVSGRVETAYIINFDGTLVINLLNGYVPAIGDAFFLIGYGGYGGGFQNLSLPPVASGQAWQVSYGSGALDLQVVADANVAAQITGSVKDNQGHPITNISVFAYTTNSPGIYVSGVTDVNGNYSLSVANGNWLVGVQGLVTLGYNTVASQPVTIYNANQIVNFVAQPFSGQNFNISLAASPAGTGTVSGGGAFASGGMITVTATPITTTLPYLFVNWTENGVVESTSSSYTFTVTRDRELVANFTLPLYTIAASNNPAGAGSIAGAGSAYYGTTNTLTATANFGYSFSNWTENAAIVGSSPILTTVVYGNHSFSANYAAVNLTHVVTTVTSPPGLATVGGAGTYNNGQTANFSAPATITSAPNIYTFQYYTLSNSVVSGSANFSKTFSTLDQTSLQYVAVYQATTILPIIAAVSANYSSPVPATTNFLLTLQFNRTMQTNFSPMILLTNSAVTLQPVIATNGVWTSSALLNDTYQTPPITFGAGMGGTSQLFVAGAQDLNGNALALTNPISYTIDVTPPAAPILAITSSNSSSVTVNWSSYVAPSDLGSFRVFIQTANFSSANGLAILTGLPASARSFQFNNLSLDTPYYVAIQAVDIAGNGSGVVTLPIKLPSTVPPPVSIQQTPVGANSALISWNGYNTASLFGFSGFYVYQQPNNFSSVAGLTPIATLGPTAASFQVNNLNRMTTNYFAVVGFNDMNAFNPAVTTAQWSDPYGGNITANTTIGGTSPSVVMIYQNIVVGNGVLLTIQPGTTLLFAPGTGLTVQSGSLIANGTALAPIILDSASDTPGNIPAAGNWGGVTLGGGASSSSLQFVEVFYGGGLTVSGCSPVINAFTAENNLSYGLGLQNGATLNTSAALLANNGVGARQLDTSDLTIENSVIQNNGTNAVAGGSTQLTANSDWWGTATASAIAATLQGNVSYNSFLTSEPVLTPAVGTINGSAQVYSPVANLELACRTASAMRVSEDYTFTGVFFSPFTNNLAFGLSAGGGLKHIFAQYRSVTGQTNVPVELDLNYTITGGPVIQSFSLAEGQTINRPLTVTGSASASLGVLDVEFYVDGALQGTNTGANLSQYFDVRTLGNAAHQVEILARDNGGNIATLANNVIVAVTPPIAPVITQPAADIITNTSTVSFTGTAEPGINILVSDNGQVLETTNANAGGNFSLANATLAEGVNSVVAVASDSTGTTSSAIRHVTVETIAPAALILNAPVYAPGTGLTVTWQFATTGKQATTYQLFWSTSPFTTTNQATSHSLVLINATDTIQGLNNGTYYFGVVGFDAAGNPSPLSALVSTVYDGTPPTLTISYSQPSPMGVGPINIVLTSSEVLTATPSLTFRPQGAASPVLLNLANSALNTYQATFTVTSATPSGTVAVSASAQDLAGNVFSGAPSGPALMIDTTPPAGVVTTTPPTPVQTVSGTNVAVSLTLSEPAASTPTLSYAPPVGSSVPITLTGSGSNWSGTLPLTSAMGSGVGLFSLSASDSVGNVGTQITSGSQLELYNTALPSPPSAPTNLVAVSLPGGQIKLTWNAVANAQIYRLYREAGTNFTLPGVLDQDNLTTNGAIDLPSADGMYSYGISASRFGSESVISNVVSALSDRTPPAAPINVAVALAASGIQITWQEPTGGEAVDHYNIYRNGTRIQTFTAVAPVVDYPPTGTANYTIGAVDTVGNENLSAPASIQLLVGPVKNLNVLVEVGQAVVLTWTATDNTVVGYNIYRNGIKQNTALITAASYTDQLPLSDTVQYAVTAVNNSPAESPPRQVSVSPVNFALLTNPNGSSSNNPLLTGYFDQFQVGITNLSSSSNLMLTQLQMERSVNGLTPLIETQNLSGVISPAANAQQNIIFPEASVVAAQSMQITAFQQTDSEGSSVTYQDTFSITSVQQPATEIAVSVNQLPLAGGLTPFQVQIYNRGYTDMQLIVSRGSGAQPGDLYISVENTLGQEVSRTTFMGTPPGTFFLPNGNAYVDIPVGASLTFTVPNVLVPAALAGSTNVTFVAVASNIYNQLGQPNQLVSGPLIGSMVSSGLAQTPYYGTAATDHSAYDNEQPVIISGQAVDRMTSAPVPNAALNIGFATRGYKWYTPVTTDANGNYQYTYNPSAGFGGSLTIWTCNPLVVDQLNQAQINIYRLYSNPGTGDITMSKNGTLNFSIQLINPGDTPLTALSTSFSATQMSGTNQVPITSITGTNLSAATINLGPNQNQMINLELAATAGAPDTAQVTFTFTSAEGASTTFIGTVSLLPALPLLTVPNPAVGYLEVSLNRGNQTSGQITVMNSGLEALQGITLTPPTNSWIAVNLPVSADGQIHLPDLGIGQSNSFTVVFNPPDTEPLDFYSDTVVIHGTNVSSSFAVNVYALVTSDLNGAVQFNVSDILGDQVSQAGIRLHNNLISADAGPFYTDTNGLLTVSNLEEGDWNWQIDAPGTTAASGVVSILADQTVSVSQILSRSLVTVSFTVVPVPFTDVYQIQVEQTFETYVPVPVLTLTPVSQTFNVTPGFQASFIATAQNQGLIQMENFNIAGSQDSSATLTPLITYAPVLLPQQTIDIPFTVTYGVTNAPARQDTSPFISCLPGGGIADDLAGFFDGLNAIANAQGVCYKSGASLVIAGTLAVLLEADAAIVTSVTEAAVGYIGCLFNQLFGNLLPNIGIGLPAINLAEPKTNPNIVNTGPSGCFAGDTRVLMADGKSKFISQIRTNDVVRTGLQPDNIASVEGFYSLVSSQVHKISIATANGKALPSLLATEEHLLWVDGRGWTAAGNLKTGDWLFNHEHQRVRVTGNKPVKGSMKVYTLRLLGDDAFYANDVLVHDMCGETPPPEVVTTVEAAK